MPFRFNIFDFYLYFAHKVTIYCPPINHERFKQEFKNRYLYEKGEEAKLKKKARHSPSNRSINSRSKNPLIEMIFHPIKTFKLVREYHMISNTNMTLQIVNILILFHLFAIATIGIAKAGINRDKIKHFKSI